MYSAGGTFPAHGPRHRARRAWQGRCFCSQRLPGSCRLQPKQLRFGIVRQSCSQCGDGCPHSDAVSSDNPQCVFAVGLLLAPSSYLRCGALRIYAWHECYAYHNTAFSCGPACPAHCVCRGDHAQQHHAKHRTLSHDQETLSHVCPCIPGHFFQCTPAFLLPYLGFPHWPRGLQPGSLASLGLNTASPLSYASHQFPLSSLPHCS